MGVDCLIEMSEKAFQNEMVLPLLLRLGYFPWHDLDSRLNDAGFPDIWAISPVTGLVVLELKSEGGYLKRCQEAWITLLRQNFVRAYVVRPSAFDALAVLLDPVAEKTVESCALYDGGGYTPRLSKDEILLGPSNVAILYHEIKRKKRKVR